jgi:hypothetical protein
VTPRDLLVSDRIPGMGSSRGEGNFQNQLALVRGEPI